MTQWDNDAATMSNDLFFLISVFSTLSLRKTGKMNLAISGFDSFCGAAGLPKAFLFDLGSKYQNANANLLGNPAANAKKC